jgi:hypothetical protein
LASVSHEPGWPGGQCYEKNIFVLKVSKLKLLLFDDKKVIITFDFVKKANFCQKLVKIAKNIALRWSKLCTVRSTEEFFGYFFCTKRLCINSYKKDWATFLAIVFTKSNGHLKFCT